LNFTNGSTNAVLNDVSPTNTTLLSWCIPFSDSVGLTAQIPVSKQRYEYIIGGLSSQYGASAGLTIGKILACKGYLPGCGLVSSAGDAPAAGGGSNTPMCTPNKTIDEILNGATGTAEQSFFLETNIVACTADSNSLLLNTICVSQDSDFLDPKRPLALVIPNYDVELRDSSKIAFAGRIANFGYYDIRTGVRIQPLYGGGGTASPLDKPATLIGYSGNKNGSQLVITDQVLTETGIYGNQGALDPRDYRSKLRYSSEDFLAAAELYDPVAQVGYVSNTPYILNLGRVDPETGALTSTVGVTLEAAAILNTSSTPQMSQGTNDQQSENGYPTY
jgi:hypothetical protein